MDLCLESTAVYHLRELTALSRVQHVYIGTRFQRSFPQLVAIGGCEKWRGRICDVRGNTARTIGSSLQCLLKGGRFLADTCEVMFRVSNEHGKLQEMYK